LEPREFRGGFFVYDAGSSSSSELIFTAGHAPIYGKQILHFLDPVFLARTLIPPAGQPNVQKHQSEPVPEESAGQAYLRYLDDLPEGVTEAV
jgi:hypothetical protein